MESDICDHTCPMGPVPCDVMGMTNISPFFCNKSWVTLICIGQEIFPVFVNKKDFCSIFM